MPSQSLCNRGWCYHIYYLLFIMGRRTFIRFLRDHLFLLARGAQTRRALLATTASVDDEQMETLRANIVAKRASVEEQGAVLKSLKTSQKAPPQVDVDAAVETLTQLKLDLAAAAKEFSSRISNRGVSSSESFRAAVNNTLEHRLFIIPSFAIYGGVTGLYDYGPPGCAVKANVLAFWRQDCSAGACERNWSSYSLIHTKIRNRLSTSQLERLVYCRANLRLVRKVKALDNPNQHFVLEENMLEVDCPCVTPEVVLKASGHVDKFTDLMVKDEKTGMCYRADHLLKDYCKEALEKDPLMDSARRDQLKEVLATIDELSAQQLGQKLKEYGIVAPDSKNPLSDPYPFNLMFSTLIGPTGIQPGYLRPETAQGIFVNFKDLYYYNGNKLPFAAAQIGQAFRNEIAPRQGLLRVREFTLAEIEHFVNPDDKSHPKFNEVAELSLLLYPREEQLAVKKPVLTRLGEAVSKGLINNETLGYFIGRTYLFLTMLGIDKTHLRFRQHLPNEMAHYAADCWDAEIECSYGWIECVGLADRSAFDLKAHTEKSKIELVAQERFSEPREIEQLTILPIKKEIGSAFRNAARKVEEALMVMSEAEALDLQSQLNSKGQVDFTVCTLGKDVTITNKMVSIFKETKKVHSRTYTPNVIEPSFGIGRIIYCLYEHCFYMRPSKSGEEQCNVFSFPPFIAPIKCTVFPLVQQERFNVVALQISKALSRAGVSYKIDTTGTSIGKRYARTDELGVPFAITVDSGTTVTIRERDSKEQARVPIDEVALVVKELVESFISWEGVKSKYPLEASKE